MKVKELRRYLAVLQDDLDVYIAFNDTCDMANVVFLDGLGSGTTFTVISNKRIVTPLKQ